jgi:hypothetical protein
MRCAPRPKTVPSRATPVHGTAELVDEHHRVRRRGGGEATGNRVDGRIVQVVD